MGVSALASVLLAANINTRDDAHAQSDKTGQIYRIYLLYYSMKPAHFAAVYFDDNWTPFERPACGRIEQLDGHCRLLRPSARPRLAALSRFAFKLTTQPSSVDTTFWHPFGQKSQLLSHSSPLLLQFLLTKFRNKSIWLERTRPGPIVNASCTCKDTRRY